MSIIINLLTGITKLRDAWPKINSNFTSLKNEVDAIVTGSADGEAAAIAVKADISYVDAQIASLASGSPKGTYPTAAALTSAFLAGNANIYVVSADGNWYYWNGTAWTAGGVYQSTGLSDIEIARQKLTENIQGTTQSIIFNSDGTVQKVQHKDSLSVVLREDVFTYGTNLITEVRTLSTGETITFINHLDTLETEVL